MAKLIQRDWRNWKPPQTPSGSTNSSPVESQGLNSSDQLPSATKPVKATKKAIRLKNTKTPAKTSKRINFNTGADIFKKKNFKMIAKNQDSGYTSDMLDDYDCHLKWSKDFERYDYKTSMNRAKGIISTRDESKDKRLASTIAIMISKLAEDKTGEPIIGEDEWDMQELMLRSITKRNIYSCMQSRERENIVLILDSSPSCEHMSRLYGKIAYLSVKLGCLDVYLAPNAHITHKLNGKTGKYERVFDIEKDKDMIICGVDDISEFFKNRIILFFGDYDGAYSIEKASKINEMHWFNNDYSIEYHEDYANYYHGAVYNCKSREDLINIIRKLR